MVASSVLGISEDEIEARRFLSFSQVLSFLDPFLPLVTRVLSWE
jgi:hypothetical protein